MSAADGTEATYWFCLKHHTVEGEDGCKAKDRLGPYASRAEAERALDKVAERNRAWDEDPDWNDGASGADGAAGAGGVPGPDRG